MNPTNRTGILFAAAVLASGACALAQGPDAGRPAGNPPPPGAPQEMRGERPDPMQHPGRGTQGAGGPQQRQPGAPNPDLLKKAGATDAQVQALQDLEFAQREKQIDVRARVEKAQLALERQMASTNADEKAVMAAVDALSLARGELMKLEIGAQLKRKQILGDELMKKLQGLRPQRPEGPEGRTPGMGGQNGPAGGMGPQGQGRRGPMPHEGQPQQPPTPPPGF